MIKKICLLFVLIGSLSITGCSSTDQTDTKPESISEKEEGNSGVAIVKKESEYADLMEEIRNASYKITEQKHISFSHTEVNSTHISFSPSYNSISASMGLRTIKGDIKLADYTGRMEVYSYPDMIGFDTYEGSTVEQYADIESTQGTLDAVFLLQGDTIKVENGTVACMDCAAAYDDGTGRMVASEFTYEDSGKHMYFNYAFTLQNWATTGLNAEDASLKIEKKKNDTGVQYVVTSTTKNVELSPTGGYQFMNTEHAYTQNLTNVIQLDKKGRIVSCNVDYPWTCDENGLTLPNRSSFIIEYDK